MIMKTVFSTKDIADSGLCIGCGICVGRSSDRVPETKMQFDVLGQLKPSGPAAWYNTPSESFSRICPFSPSAVNENHLAEELFPDTKNHHPSTGRFESNFVGYVTEDDFRRTGSSGGLVSWVASELMRKGLVDGVAHVVARENDERFFRYRISTNVQEIREGAGSRYYPLELSGILKTIRDVPGRYAIVAVPCMIKAIQLLRRNDPVYKERIRYTLGLFCGHMKSARFVESFAWQMKVPIREVKKVEFRFKQPDRPANWYNAMLLLHNGQSVQRDWWHMVDGDWGAGYFMNSACNYCDDVVAETADISFGDAWVEPYSSDGKGTNVVITRSSHIHQLILAGIRENRLSLEEVTAQFVEQTQAAGFRQRREGLAYRLTWKQKGVLPQKRVKADSEKLSGDRKRIYRMRYRISKWSHRMFRMARILRLPLIYLFWGRVIAAIYYGVAYHQGKRQAIFKRFRQLHRKRH